MTASLAITFLYEGTDLDGEQAIHVLERMLNLFPEGDPDRPQTFQIALSRLPLSDLERRLSEWAAGSTETENDMGLTKHGEGSIIAESEQQKTAAQQGGMTEQDREALRQENEEADGGLGRGDERA